MLFCKTAALFFFLIDENPLMDLATGLLKYKMLLFLWLGRNNKGCKQDQDAISDLISLPGLWGLVLVGMNGTGEADSSNSAVNGY